MEVDFRIDPSTPTSLYNAVQYGHTKVCEAMIDAGADVNTICYDQTPLYVASNSS